MIVAIEWTVESSEESFLIRGLLEEVRANIGAMIHVPIDCLNVKGWRGGWHLEDANPPTLVVDGDFADGSLVVTAGVDQLLGLVEVDSHWEVEDVGETYPPRLARVVTSARSQFSVVLGVACAIAVLRQGGGELAGVGLSGRYRRHDIPRVVQDLEYLTGSSIEAVRHIARRLGSGSLPVSLPSESWQCD